MRKVDVKIYSAYELPDAEAYDFRDEDCPVVQYLRDESDVNNIVSLWSKGVLPSPNRLPQRYVDCTQIEDFQHALDVLCDAEDILDQMTASQRARFQDDPVSFIEYFSDPAHEEEFRNLSLANSPLTKLNEQNGSDVKNSTGEKVEPKHSE